MTILYMLTAPSGKQYIGVTGKPLSYRISDHIYCQSIVGQALQKYGRETFKTEILVAGAEEYIYELERRAIEAFDTRAPNGYNLAEGGLGGRLTEEAKQKIGAATRLRYAEGRAHPPGMLGKKHTPETLQRMSEAKQGAKNPSWGRKVTEETRQKMSHATKHSHAKGLGVGMLGKRHSEKTKLKMSETHKKYWAEKRKV